MAPESRTRELAKRGLDLALAVMALPLALPLILAAGAAIALETPGGMFFRQERIGRFGRPFRVWKLRTMVQDAEREGAGLYAERNDPRFTRVGLWARRWSLDELPQLFNVLAGDMSIVGPRPLPLQIVQEHADAYAVILRVRPGLTGLSQVSGRNDLVRSRRLELDQQYAREWKLGLDARIILRTIGVVLSAAGQRNDQGRADVER